MSYFLLCLFVFLSAYTVNLLYISVFYHRGLTHSAVILTPWLKSFVLHTGNWVTGLDPKGWSCMHRLHHVHSDTPKDPHSPVPSGVFSVFNKQLDSYKRILAGLILGKSSYNAIVSDLDFPVSWINRNGMWYLPYLFHFGVVLAIGIIFHAWWLAAAYYLGMMSHPVQGWMVNALAHRYGYRNFNTPDNSRNNTAVAWLVFGEGFQNNHHETPSSAKFSVKWWEVDFGYGLVRLLVFFHLIKIS